MTLTIDMLELGPVGTNTYVVRSAPDTADAVVIDPSGEASAILARLAEIGASCAAILVTHGHFDHVISLADLAEETGASVYAPAAERVLVENPPEFAPLGVVPRAWPVDTALSGGDEIEVAGIRFSVYSVPGHSPGHLAYAADGHVFSGDVLFAGSVGRTDLPGSSWDVLQRSIEHLLDVLPPETIVCPGHGPTTTLGAELARNPFLADLRSAKQSE